MAAGAGAAAGANGPECQLLNIQGSHQLLNQVQAQHQNQSSVPAPDGDIRPKTFRVNKKSNREE